MCYANVVCVCMFLCRLCGVAAPRESGWGHVQWTTSEVGRGEGGEEFSNDMDWMFTIISFVSTSLYASFSLSSLQ